MTLEYFVDLLVVGFVLAIQAFLLLASIRSSRPDKKDELAVLTHRFSGDIQRRATKGLPPDWLRYQSEIDRIYETSDERLRIYASAALAAGMGGTILALILHLLLAQRASEFNPISLVMGMGVALFGSLSGVLNNLYIVLRLLPKAENQFNEVSNEMQAHLRRMSETAHPQEQFSKAMREELTQLTQVFQANFSTAVSEAITGFPDIVKGLYEQVGALARVVEDQSEFFKSAIGDLRDTANAVEVSGAAIGPVAAQLTEATKSLLAMPDELKRVLEESRESWLEGIHKDQQQYLAQLLELHKSAEIRLERREKLMVDAVTRVQEAVDHLPKQLSIEVKEMSKELAADFALESRNHVNELRQVVDEKMDQLLSRVEHHETQWRNNIGTTVVELLEQIKSTVDDRLLGDLSRVSEELQKTSSSLPGIAAALAAAHKDWSDSQKSTLAGWREASDRAYEAAQTLVNADGQLKVAVDSLVKASDGLDRIAKSTDDFEKNLQQALQRATEEHLNGLKPIHHELTELVREVREAQGRVDRSLDGQIAFIRQCIGALLKGRSVATIGGSR